MLEIKTRKEFGFENDRFPGYVALKNGEAVVQLHIYADCYSVFWRGEFPLPMLDDYLELAARDIGSTFDMPFEDLNRGIARYLCDGKLKSLPFVIRTKTQSEEMFERERSNFVRSHSDLITFARLDISSKVPVTLWGDIRSTITNPKHEVGFSSIKMIPRNVMQMFLTTSLIRLTQSELTEAYAELNQLVSQETREVAQ